MLQYISISSQSEHGNIGKKEERTELLLLLQTDNLLSNNKIGNLVYSRLIESVKAELYSKGFIYKII